MEGGRLVKELDEDGPYETKDEGDRPWKGGRGRTVGEGGRGWIVEG